jgi:O-antigen ligase
MASWGLWVVLFWVMIIGSRSVSVWLNPGIEAESPEAYLEGTTLDRNIFLVLIILGVVALLQRRPDWRNIFNSNRWFFAFLFYCGISIIWSDYPTVSFKRWAKELGNVIMVLIILTEEDIVLAIRAVISRYTYLAIPLSVLLIGSFPEIGSYIDRDMFTPAHGGVATHKNSLGIITFISGLFLVWDLVYLRGEDVIRTDKADVLCRYVLLLMVAWLMYMAQSATALVSLILGTSILLFMKLPFPRSQIRFLGTYSLVLSLLVLFLYSVPGVLDGFAKVLGRDMTFTGRTELWADLLNEHINPILGTGYQSFWLGARADYLWDKYLFHPIQAHNGYLETYLNGGLIGLCLLMATIVFTGNRLRREVLHESSFGILLFACLVVAVFYNWTEAMFSRLNLIWFVLGIAALYHPPSYESLPERDIPLTRDEQL